MGRLDEALAWHRLVLRDQPADPISRAAVARLEAAIGRGGGPTLMAGRSGDEALLGASHEPPYLPRSSVLDGRRDGLHHLIEVRQERTCCRHATLPGMIDPEDMDTGHVVGEGDAAISEKGISISSHEIPVQVGFGRMRDRCVRATRRSLKSET